MCFFADEQRGYFGTIQHGAAPHGQTNAHANKKTTENGSEEFIVRNIGIMNKGNTQRQAGDSQGAFYSEARTQFIVTQNNKRYIDNEYKDGC